MYENNADQFSGAISRARALADRISTEREQAANEDQKLREKSFEEKYHILSTKIADIRELIPIEWFDEQHSCALAETVACPELCLHWIKEYVINITKRNYRLEADNFKQNEEIAMLWDRV